MRLVNKRQGEELVQRKALIKDRVQSYQVPNYMTGLQDVAPYQNLVCLVIEVLCEFFLFLDGFSTKTVALSMNSIVKLICLLCLHSM